MMSFHFLLLCCHSTLAPDSKSVYYYNILESNLQHEAGAVLFSLPYRAGVPDMQELEGCQIVGFCQLKGEKGYDYYYFSPGKLIR